MTPGCVGSPTGNPTSAHTLLPESHFLDWPAAVYYTRDQLPRSNQRLKTPVKDCMFWVSTLQVKLKKLLMAVFRENQMSPTKKPVCLRHSLEIHSRLHTLTSLNCLHGKQSEQTMGQLSNISLFLWAKQSLL